MTATATDVINNVAVEVGLDAATDPFSSTDKSMVQLVYLLNTSMRELGVVREWQEFRREKTFTTAGPDTGIYDLPVDFERMVKQTHWDRTNDNPISGSVSAQEWQWLQTQTSTPIYASFRQMQNKLYFYPAPLDVGLAIAYEYQSTNYVYSPSNVAYQAKALVAADVVQYDQTLIERKLKVKFLSAKGFDSAAARAELKEVLNGRFGTNVVGKILDAGSPRGSSQLLTDYNLPRTGYGA